MRLHARGCSLLSPGVVWVTRGICRVGADAEQSDARLTLGWRTEPELNAACLLRVTILNEVDFASCNQYGSASMLNRSKIVRNIDVCTFRRPAQLRYEKVLLASRSSIVVDTNRDKAIRNLGNVSVFRSFVVLAEAVRTLVFFCRPCLASLRRCRRSQQRRASRRDVSNCFDTLNRRGSSRCVCWSLKT